MFKVVCEGCRGECGGLAECCDGSGGCPCRGQPYFPWTCSVCKGSGKGNASDFLRTALQQRDEEWRELVGYVRESAESCAVLARENESNNIRNNIIRPLDDIITKSKEI